MFSELEECILNPLRRLFNSKLSTVHQLVVLSYLGKLAQHWAAMEYVRHKDFKNGAFPMVNANFTSGPMDSLSNLCDTIRSMSESGFCQLVQSDKRSEMHSLVLNTYIQENLFIFQSVRADRMISLRTAINFGFFFS